MKYSVFTLFAFAAALVAAAPTEQVKRQVADNVSVDQPAMTDGNGNIIPFDAAVYAANKANGSV